MACLMVCSRFLWNVITCWETLLIGSVNFSWKIDQIYCLTVEDRNHCSWITFYGDLRRSDWLNVFTMRNVSIASLLVLFIQRIYTGGSDVINCAGCFAQKWNWASWQCDVHCDVKVSKYGKCSFILATIVSYKPSHQIRKQIQQDRLRK